MFEPVRILGCSQWRSSFADVNRKNVKERGQPDTEPTGPRSGIRGVRWTVTFLPGHGKLLHSRASSEPFGFSAQGQTPRETLQLVMRVCARPHSGGQDSRISSLSRIPHPSPRPSLMLVSAPSEKCSVTVG